MSIRFRLLVSALAAGTMVLGILQLTRMPVGVLPETYLTRSLADLRVALAAAGVLAALALLALLLQLRLAFTALSGVALSLVAGTATLSAFGYTFSALVTLGLLLALGLAVTEAVGEAQAIADRLGSGQPSSGEPGGEPGGEAGGEAGRGPARTAALVAAACAELRGTLSGAGLAAVACGIPLLLATGQTASFLRPMAMAFALAVVVSVVVAVTVTPAIAAFLYTVVPPRAHATTLPQRLAAGSARLAGALARRPRLVMAGAIASAAAGIAALALLPGLAVAGTSRITFVSYVAVALAVALLTAQAATGSWRFAALAFGSLPVSLSGGVFTAYALGATGELAAAAGLAAVFAIAVRQSVTATVRLRTGAAAGTVILTPALVAAVTMLPFITMGDIPGMELLHTAAAMILGGLVTTTLVTLFALPAAGQVLGPWAAADSAIAASAPGAVHVPDRRSGTRRRS